MSTTPPGWMTLSQAAAHYGVGRSTVNRLVDSGEWPSTLLPGMTHRRISPADQKVIETNAVRYVAKATA